MDHMINSVHVDVKSVSKAGGSNGRERHYYNQASTGIQCWCNSNTNHFGIIPIVSSHVSTN